MAVPWDPKRHQRTADWAQENLDESDAALSAELKQRYPIQSRQEIEEKYPNKWVAILPTRVDHLNSTREGRFLVSARGRRAFELLLQPLRTELPPGCHLFTYFNYRPKHPVSHARAADRRNQVRSAS